MTPNAATSDARIDRGFAWAKAKLNRAIHEARNPERDWEIIQKVADQWQLPLKVVIAASLSFEKPELAAEPSGKLVDMTVLFTAPASDKSEGRVGKLTMRLHTVEGRPEEHVFVPSRRMLWVKDSMFIGAFETALKAILALDPAHQIELSDLVVEWDIALVGTSTPPRQLTGKSLGGAIAIGLLQLLAANVPRDHKCRPYLGGLNALFHSREAWGMTAEINEEGDLFWPLHVESKLRSPHCPHTVYYGARNSEKPRAVTGNLRPVYDIQTFLRSLGDQDGLPVPAPQRSQDLLARWAIVLLVLAIAGGLLFYLLSPKPRSLLELTNSRLNSLLLPSGCKQIIQIKKTFTQKEWDTEILPSLKTQMHPFALILGDAEEWTKQSYVSKPVLQKAISDVLKRPFWWVPDPQPVSLRGISDLQLLHTLTLHPSNITEIPEIEKMIYLERLALFGSCVTSLRGCTNLQNLRTLVIDSGFLEDYPQEYAFPNLETLILQTSIDTKTVDFSKCRSLKRLCICGANLEVIKGLEDLPLTDLSIYAFKLAPGTSISSMAATNGPPAGQTGNSPSTAASRDQTRSERHPATVRRSTGEVGTLLPISLKRLKLYRAARIEGIDLSNMEELLLDEVSISRLEHEGYCGVKKIEISQAADLKAIDLKPFGSLEELIVKDTPLSAIRSLDQCRSLRSLSLTKTLVSQLPGISTLKNLKLLSVSESKLDHLPLLATDDYCSLSWENTPLEKRINALLKANGISEGAVSWGKIDGGPPGYSIDLNGGESFRRLSESTEGELVLGHEEMHRPSNSGWGDSGYYGSGWGGDTFSFANELKWNGEPWPSGRLHGLYAGQTKLQPFGHLNGGCFIPSSLSGGSRWIGNGLIVFKVDERFFQFLDGHGWPVQSAYFPEYRQFNSRSVTGRSEWNMEVDLGLEAIRQMVVDANKPRISPFRREPTDNVEKPIKDPLNEELPPLGGTTVPILDSRASNGSKAPQ